MDITDELQLYWPVGARVVGYDGHRDIDGTIREHTADELLVDDHAGPWRLPLGVLISLSVTGRGAYGERMDSPMTEVRLRVESGDVTPIRQAPTAPDGPRITPAEPEQIAPAEPAWLAEPGSGRVIGIPRRSPSERAEPRPTIAELQDAVRALGEGSPVIRHLTGPRRPPGC